MALMAQTILSGSPTFSEFNSSDSKAVANGWESTGIVNGPISNWNGETLYGG